MCILLHVMFKNTCTSYIYIYVDLHLHVLYACSFVRRNQDMCILFGGTFARR